MKSKFLAELLFWLHLPIVIVWVGLFFIPKSLWADKVVFHFWYIIILVAIQLLWGMAFFSYNKKLDLICPQTTLMQWLRGFEVKDKKNYNYSFTEELANRLGLKIHYKGVNIILLFTLIIVVIQYIWFR